MKNIALKLPPWEGDLLDFSPNVRPCCHSKLFSCSQIPSNEGPRGDARDFSPEMSSSIAVLFSQSEMKNSKKKKKEQCFFSLSWYSVYGSKWKRVATSSHCALASLQLVRVECLHLPSAEPASTLRIPLRFQLVN